MRLADEVKARAGAAQVRVVAEAAHRGEFTSARRGVGSVHAWVREHAPSLCQDGAAQVAQLAQDVACSVPGGLWSTAGPGAGAYADPERPEGIVWARVLTGEVGPRLALTVLREVGRLREQLEPEAVPTVATAMTDFGVQWGSQDVRKLRTALVARFGRPGELDDLQDRLRAGAYLSVPAIHDGDVTQYELALTPEQAAMLEAAIGPLSQPAPNDVTGERDHAPGGSAPRRSTGRGVWSASPVTMPRGRPRVVRRRRCTSAWTSRTCSPTSPSPTPTTDAGEQDSS